MQARAVNPRATILAGALAGLATTFVAGPAGAASDPWLDRVRTFEPGTSAGFGADQLPAIVLGAPEGLGDGAGSTDVVSLGDGGRIVVSFDDNGIVDGPGDDLVVFENAFWSGPLLFAELAYVEVSADGRAWYAFPYDAGTGEGLAGRAPVYASSMNAMDPLDPSSGGDRFDLADVGLEFARYVRITDVGGEIPDPGDDTFAGTKGGFDLDAAAAIHSTALGCVFGFVTKDGQPLGGVRVVLATEGQRNRRRWTKPNGLFAFCRLQPGLDYDLRTRGLEAGTAHAQATVGAGHLHVRKDLAVE